MKLHIDFETRSPVDLVTRGAYLYAAEAEIICMAWAIDDEPVQVWKPLEGEPFPMRVHRAILDDADCYAHNAEFEAAIFNALLPAYAPQDWQWICTANLAAACALPRALGPLAQCMDLGARKDVAGYDLIKRMCIPPYEDTPYLREQMYAYCAQDTEVERLVAGTLRQLTLTEHQDFQVNLIINQQGLPIDTELAALAAARAEEERLALAEEVSYLTYGMVQTTAGAGLRDWVYNNLAGADRGAMLREEKVVLDKHVRAELLELPDLSPVVRDVLECSDEASKSSVAKFRSMLNRADYDARVRGAYLLNGAGQTGRYSSTGLQLHNFPRASVDDPEEVIAQLQAGKPVSLDTLSKLLRPAIQAPAWRSLVWGDWSAIEGRVCPWLADSSTGEAKLDVFRAGLDPYVVTAAKMFHSGNLEAVDDDDRQKGKVAELSLQFGGAGGALNNMARNYGLRFDDPRPLVEAWRRANPWAGPFWRALEKAAMSAVSDPLQIYPAGRVKYVYIPDVLVAPGTLWCVLPSGRALAYPGAQLVEGKYGAELIAIKGSRRPRKGEPWPTVKLWYGLLCENITQAAAADILRGALRELVLDPDDRVLLPSDTVVIGHTHDEILLECADSRVQETELLLRQVMTRVPAWARGLPLAAKIDNGKRYGK